MVGKGGDSMFKHLKYLYYTKKYRKLNRYYYIIKAIEEISKEHTTQAGYFWTSISHIQKKLKVTKDKKYLSNIINYFCYAGILRKLKDTEINTSHLSVSYSETDTKNYKNRINYFIVEEPSPKVKEKLLEKISVCNFSYEIIKIKKGEDIAKSIYVCYDEENSQRPAGLRPIISKKTEQEREDRQYILDFFFRKLIDEKKVFTKDDIFNLFLANGISKKRAERIVYTYIDAILGKYNYDYIYTNGEMKEKYKLNFHGYKKIYIRKGN